MSNAITVKLNKTAYGRRYDVCNVMVGTKIGYEIRRNDEGEDFWFFCSVNDDLLEEVGLPTIFHSEETYTNFKDAEKGFVDFLKKFVNLIEK